MGIVGRLDQYASMLAGEFDDYSMSENLFLYSEQYNQSSWVNTGSTETTNTTETLSPDGFNTAEKLIGNNGVTGRQSIYQDVSCTSGTTYTFSVFLKQAERRYATIWFDTASISEGAFYGAATYLDLQTGTVANSNQSKIVAYPNGWYRCYVTATPTFTGTLRLNTSIGTPNNAGDTGAPAIYKYTGDGVSGIYIWGGQLETGTSLTDYTPTTTTTKTRVLSSTTNTNITGLSTYFSSGFSENVGAATTLAANVFPPYDLVYDDFGGTLFGAGQGRYMRQNTDKSVIVYNEIDEVSDFRDIVRTGLVLDLDAAQPLSYKGTGTVWNDLSGNGNNFTLVNPTYYSFDSSIDSISFTRTLSPTPEDGGYATLNTSGILTAANYLHNNHTTEVWFKSNDRNPTNYDATETLSVVVAYTGFHCMWHYNTTTYQYTIWGKTSGVNNIYTQTISDSTSGVWTQLVAVRTGNTLDLYKNGVFQNTGTITAGTEGIPSNNIIRIAAANYGGQYSWHANLNFASLKMYTRALTSTEIQQNYNALKHRFGL